MYNWRDEIKDRKTQETVLYIASNGLKELLSGSEETPLNNIMGMFNKLVGILDRYEKELKFYEETRREGTWYSELSPEELKVVNSITDRDGEEGLLAVDISLLNKLIKQLDSREEN